MTQSDASAETDGQDLMSLYSRRILALAADIPHAERLEAPDASATKRSPLCGSTVTVDVRMSGGVLADLGMEPRACALGQASASVLGRVAIGKTRAEIAAARDALRAMLKENAPPPGGDFAELEVLLPARAYKHRHASVLLAYDALVEAMEAAEG